MIKTKEDLKEYIIMDNGYLHEIRDKKCKFIMHFTIFLGMKINHTKMAKKFFMELLKF